MQIQTTTDGDKYYTELPVGYKVATIDDFYTEGKLIVNKPYLIHSQRQPERYWAKRSKPGFTEHNDFFVFMELGRIYVFG